jgi:hypothetical protein
LGQWVGWLVEEDWEGRYLWRDEVWAEVDRREVFDGGGHVGGGIGAVFWVGHWSVLQRWRLALAMWSGG